MKKYSITLIICIIIISVFLFIYKIKSPTKLPFESSKTNCQIDSDCLITCAHGCVSANWMKNRGDCEMMPGYTCICFENNCIDKGLKPEEIPN